MRTCNFPGCTTSIEGAKTGTLWCKECRLKMNKNRGARREGRRVRQALYPNQHRVATPNGNERRTEPREPQVKCKHCYGMPWARVPGRLNDFSGSMGIPSQEVVENGLCRGCGLPYAPEPEIELCGSVRSSAGMACDFGRLHGSEPVYRGTGSAKR